MTESSSTFSHGVLIDVLKNDSHALSQDEILRIAEAAVFAKFETKPPQVLQNAELGYD
jgi:hypothetical protein